MRLMMSLLLIAHGIAHLVGFVAGWRLARLPELPYKTTVFAGHLDIGDAGVKVMGALWLAAAVLFVTAGMALRLHASWAYDAIGAGIAGSLLLCVVGWPDAKIGVVMNLFVGALLFLATRTGG